MIIYKATNKNNGKVYIGQTTNTLEYRKQQHIREMRSSKKHNTYFLNALSYYGPESFLFEEIDSASSLEELNNKEKYWIEFFDSTNRIRGYNLDSGGNNNKKSKETRQKIGAKTAERWNNPEIAAAMRRGLVSATEAWRAKAQSNRVSKQCVVCGTIFSLPPWQAKKAEYCSSECRLTTDKRIEYAARASRAAAIISHKRNVENKRLVANSILRWCCENSDVVKSCPKNKITSHLSGLFNHVHSEFGFKDPRSVFVCFNVKNLKELLSYLQLYLDNENIC